MKLKDIVNEKNDVRKYMSVDMPDEVKDELEASGDYDVDSVLQAARIYVDAYKFDEEIIPLKLNDNQKIVLEWLVAYADKDSGDYPMQTIVYMWDCIRSDRLGVKELAALRKLTRDEQFEVLAAFAQWGLEQEEAE